MHMKMYYRIAEFMSSFNLMNRLLCVRKCHLFARAEVFSILSAMKSDWICRSWFVHTYNSKLSNVLIKHHQWLLHTAVNSFVAKWWAPFFHMNNSESNIGCSYDERTNNNNNFTAHVVRHHAYNHRIRFHIIFLFFFLVY